MKVVEIFYSLQGEGRFVGYPSVFVRLAGCPLQCKWCDTKYAWDASSAQKMTVEQILAEISDHPTRYVVITGGEPIGTEGLSELVDAIKKSQRHVTIETCGVRHEADLKCDLMSISPKMSNSTPSGPHAIEHEHARYNLPVLQKLIAEYEYQLKFVVDEESDLNEIAQCLEQIGEVNPYKVMLMPQAVTPDEYIAKSKMLAEVCKQTGFVMSQRLHIMLWGKTKGK